ncbi:MAG: hypothetical protein ABEI96_09455 [Haloarculaceae archaeon]
MHAVTRIERGRRAVAGDEEGSDPTGDSPATEVEHSLESTVGRGSTMATPGAALPTSETAEGHPLEGCEGFGKAVGVPDAKP